MLQNKLAGAGAAMITPFTPDGRVDYQALARMLEDAEVLPQPAPP